MEQHLNDFNDLINQRNYYRQQENEARKKLLEIQLIIGQHLGFNIGDKAKFKKTKSYYKLWEKSRFYVSGFAFDNKGELRVVCNWKPPKSKKPNTAGMWFKATEIELADD